jgi:RNA-directed DNA polymerase
MIRNKANLFEQVTSFSNLLEAVRKAAKGKRLKTDLSKFMGNREEALINLQAELRDQTWRPGGFHTFQIYEPKPRRISSTCFKDRVVHQALCQVIAKDLDRMSIEDSYACRQGKGLHKAIQKVQVESRKWQYYLKIDIMHFFETAESQYWSNFYLGKLDLMIKHELKVKGYVRYMDDMLLFANEISTLQSHLLTIKTFVEHELKLKLKDQATLFASISHGIPYLGLGRCRQ